jgi:hypothetical protein
MNLESDFIDTLVDPNATACIKTENAWYTLKDTKFNEALIRKHLYDEEIYGQRLSNSKKKFTVLDFDRKEGQSPEDFKQLISKVANIFQCPKLSMRSSVSGNCHMMLFFNNINPSIVKERINGTLLANNITPKHALDDSVEVFVSNKGIRLPFGRGSLLLDQDTLDPIDSKMAGMLKAIEYVSALGKLPSVYAATPSYQQYTQSKLNDQSADWLAAENLKDLGLTVSGSTNEALLVMARHYFIQTKYDKVRTEELLVEWIDTHHNGVSSGYNRNPDSIYTQIKHIVKGLKSQPRLDRSMHLDLWVCEYIVEEYPGLISYPRQRGLFELFQFIKKTSLDRGDLYIAKDLMLNEFGFTTHTYKDVLEKLKEDEFLTLLNMGNSFKKHASLYKYIGPAFDKYGGVQTYTKFLVENDYLTVGEPFSAHIIKRIRREFEEEQLCPFNMRK